MPQYGAVTAMNGEQVRTPVTGGSYTLPYVTVTNGPTRIVDSNGLPLSTHGRMVLRRGSKVVARVSVPSARRTLTVKVPAGVEDGMRIRLPGEGETGPGGGPAGDLYVQVAEREHPVFVRDGANLHCQIDLPMTAAALGCSVPLPTLDGEETLEVRPGTQPGHVITLRGKGVPHLRNEGHRGDLSVHIGVTVPTKLDAMTLVCEFSQRPQR